MKNTDITVVKNTSDLYSSTIGVIIAFTLLHAAASPVIRSGAHMRRRGPGSWLHRSQSVRRGSKRDKSP
jgi:hypothetical protein